MYRWTNPWMQEARQGQPVCLWTPGHPGQKEHAGEHRNLHKGTGAPVRESTVLCLLPLENELHRARNLYFHFSFLISGHGGSPHSGHSTLHGGNDMLYRTDITGSPGQSHISSQTQILLFNSYQKKLNDQSFMCGGMKVVLSCQTQVLEWNHLGSSGTSIFHFIYLSIHKNKGKGGEHSLSITASASLHLGPRAPNASFPLRPVLGDSVLGLLSLRDTWMKCLAVLGI